MFTPNSISAVHAMWNLQMKDTLGTINQVVLFEVLNLGSQVVSLVEGSTCIILCVTVMKIYICAQYYNINVMSNYTT